jgi:aminoglycoside 6'-N-acetyltransferase
LNEVPIGMVQIIDPFEEETHYWGDVDRNKRAIDIWIGEEEQLNKGYGTEMMRLAIARCFENPDVDGILIDPLKSNTRAHRFYERMGFEFLEERVFDDSVCFVYELKRKTPIIQST